MSLNFGIFEEKVFIKKFLKKISKMIKVLVYGTPSQVNVEECINYPPPPL